MINFQHICPFNGVQLLHQITLNPDLWKADTFLRDYPQGPFGDTETIFVRFPPLSVNELEASRVDQHESIWMAGAVLLPAARPLVMSLMTLVEGERIGRVMINRLKPGGKVFPHADTPAHAEYWDRYHFVLQSSPGCNFRCGDETVYMQPNNVYWFDNSKEHEVVNNGKFPRIHMIVDIRTYHIDITAKTPTKTV